ncbi:hypothetical protein [Bombella saccharophila]|uniref:Uncharacterized protein n=1 Tax=Bombella saccharophila TaxID=2967338 RepID=A0ABT3WBF1_9PROT|nr:hypothetical protein [Bombella saccharophila]MCX5615119.1 hypothetical protein [Bombella saccharophila]PHI96204.1 hypothetical protein BG621_04340 [Parasaccharibacter apium]
MMTGFACALVLVLMSLGRDGRWLPLYGIVCAVLAGTSGTSWVAVLCVLVLPIANLLLWGVVRHFTVGQGRVAARGRDVLPVVMTLLLQFVLAFFGAGLGLVPTFGIGLVLAGLCAAVCGEALSQFCGLVMAVDGLLVLASILPSWGVFVMGLALWGVLVFLALVLLPRLAWWRVEDD